MSAAALRAALPRLRGMRLLAMLLLALVSGSTALRAQTPPRGDELEALTRAVAAQLRCPVCQGESIQDSPADLAREMRAVVHDQLAAGRTPDEVKAYFVARYGEWILLAPPARGFNLVLYILPFAGLLGGGLVLVVVARRWQRRTPSGAHAALTRALDDEY